MRPIDFPQSNAVFGEHQEAYQSLPAYYGPDGEVITCWELDDDEIKELIVTGKLWIRQLTFGSTLQPQLPQTGRPFKDEA